MKLFSILCRGLSLLLIIPALSMAQGGQDYTILLKSGGFTPAENINRISKNTGAFRNSLFQNKYYVTVQFYSLPDPKMKNRLAASGIELIDYIPNHAFTVAVSSEFDFSEFRSFPIRSIFYFSPEQKTITEIREGKVPGHAEKITGYSDVSVITYEKISATALSGTLKSLDASIIEDLPVFRSFTIRVAQKNLMQLVNLPFVQWVEFIPPPNQEENLPGRSLHRVNVLGDGPRNLKGDGINVGIWDAGEISPHLDFLPAGRLNQIEFNSPQSHSTHCSGTILGRGLIDYRARGMAPNATLYSYNYSGNIQSEMSTAIPLYNLVVSSHSYNDGGSITCNLSGTQIAYTSVSRNSDLNLNNYPYHLHVHSSGNNQTSCANGWYTITGTGKSAKNNIVVGSVTSTEAISSFSSFGPVADGRVKPEITSMGSNVYSTYSPLNSYATISGTSMATPGVAGSLTLLVQRYKQLNGNALPPSSLIKNIACNAAADLGNPGPDYRFGFGRINDLAAVRILEDNRYVINSMSTGGSNDMMINIPAGTAKLRVMLTWNDPAAAANANPALVNNLDLQVINGATTTLPWILDRFNPGNTATRAVDNISNIEQVTVDNPPSGSYTLRVLGTAIPTGPQEYSLTWIIDQPYIEVTYPNGGESFNPGSTEVITWDNAGVTSNQTVEYSLDNGATWTTISSSVSPATTRLSWTVPAGANTSAAQIRISSGSLTDASDVNFKILGIPTGFGSGASSCTSGTVNFIWSAVANATHYDIYKLNPSTGQWEVLASNVTGTSYSATSLTPGANLWFTIVAKNNTTGAASERANAINITVSSGGVASIGSITGLTSICGATSNVSYSVSPVTGATGYTWTVPPGAVIAGGSGTNSITVNFPSGSSNGDVTVYASSGTCQTATAVLSIAVNSNAIAAPVSGGNQSQTTCPANPNPTLTATANVPAGYSVVWYDASAGGNVIASPVLNSNGTITLYAASVNNSSGCESNTRTAVTLTLTAMPATIITPGGPTTFCQGGNVTLSANTGNSYLWSNNATTPSITVGASGTYTVTVDYGNGCFNTSPATVVTVNTAPPASVVPGSATTFCEGNNVLLTSATTGSTYLWSNGAATSSISVIQSGNYSVSVTYANGCSSTSSPTLVTVNPRPLVSITALPYTRLYPGLSTTLTAQVSSPSSVTYSWTRNGSVISGAASSTLPVSLSGLGNYAVTVTNTSGCSNTSNLMNISDSASSRLFIFPNPNSGQFQVSYYHTGATSSYTMTIFNSAGALVMKSPYTVTGPYDLMNVDMRKFGKGVYQVVISDNNGKRLAKGGVAVQ